MQSNLAGPDYYTRAILGEKITLVLGKPMSATLSLVPRAAPPVASIKSIKKVNVSGLVAAPAAPAEPERETVAGTSVPTREQVQQVVAKVMPSSAMASKSSMHPSLRARIANLPQWVRVGALVVAAPAIVFLGAWATRSLEGVIFGDPLPGIGAKPSSVRVVDQDYKAPIAAPQSGGPLPVTGQVTQEPASAPMGVGGPLPIPMSKGMPDVVPAPQLPLDILTRAPAGGATPAKAEKKEQPPALVVDDGAAKSAASAAHPAPAAPPTAPKAPAAAPVQPAKPLASPAQAPAATPRAAAPAGPVKLAQPVEERSAQVAPPAKAEAAAAAAPAPSPASKANEAKITIVDIVPGGKAVLVTNPATRLPQRVSIGEKLPNGRTVQSIDEKAGSVTADGATYKIE